jgi:hypothetical protein
VHDLEGVVAGPEEALVWLSVVRVSEVAHAAGDVVREKSVVVVPTDQDFASAFRDREVAFVSNGRRSFGEVEYPNLRVVEYELLLR